MRIAVFRSVRNFIIDTTAIAPTTEAIGIHWQVAQATSLEAITVKMSAAAGTQHTGFVAPQSPDLRTGKLMTSC